MRSEAVRDEPLGRRKPAKATRPAKVAKATRAAKAVTSVEPATVAKADKLRSRKGAQTRARLIDAAKFIFERDGFLEARIADIAERAGVSHGSFYHYFDSKEEVVREVAEAQEAELTAPPHEDEEPVVTELERIQRANRRYFERYRDNAKIMAVVEEVSRYDDYVNDARMRRQHHFADRADKAIRRFQDAGMADAAIDPEIAALALGAMVGRFAELWFVEEWGEYDLDHVVEQVSKLWANAIGLSEPAKKPSRKRSS